MDLFTLALASAMKGSGGEGGSSIVSTNVVEIEHNSQTSKDYPTQTADQIETHIVNGEPSYLKVDDSLLPITILNTQDGYMAYVLKFDLSNSVFNDYYIYSWSTGEVNIDSFSVHTS